jgi:hypothetical protein
MNSKKTCPVCPVVTYLTLMNCTFVEFSDDAEPLLGEVNDLHELSNLVEVERDQSEDEDDLMTLMIGKRNSR